MSPFEVLVLVLVLILLARVIEPKPFPRIAKGQAAPLWLSIMVSGDYLRVGRWFIPTYSLVLQIPILAIPHSFYDFGEGVQKYGWRAMTIGTAIGYDSEGVKMVLGTAWRPLGVYKGR